MPQLSSVVLKDRTTPTPVDHTFAPRDIVDRVGTVVKSTGVPLGDERLSISLRKTAPTENGRYRAELKLAIPVIVNETINGVTVPKVARTAFADVTFTFDPRSTEAERNDLVGLLQSALGADKTLINDTVVKLQGIY